MRFNSGVTPDRTFGQPPGDRLRLYAPRPACAKRGDIGTAPGPPRPEGQVSTAGGVTMNLTRVPGRGDVLRKRIGRQIKQSIVRIRLTVNRQSSIITADFAGFCKGLTQQTIPQLAPGNRRCSHRSRSEERRVGKECRYRWSADLCRNKTR